LAAFPALSNWGIQLVSNALKATTATGTVAHI